MRRRLQNFGIIESTPTSMRHLQLVLEYSL